MAADCHPVEMVVANAFPLSGKIPTGTFWGFSNRYFLGLSGRFYWESPGVSRFEKSSHFDEQVASRWRQPAVVLKTSFFARRVSGEVEQNREAVKSTDKKNSFL